MKNPVPGLYFLADLMADTKVAGGYTNCVFNRMEGKLIDSPRSEDYLISVFVLVDFEKLNEYESLIDYIFCETWALPWKGKAKLFYGNKGPPLVDDVDLVSRELLWYDVIMSRVLIEICSRSWEKDGTHVVGEDQVQSWKEAVSYMRSMFKGECLLRGRPHFRKIGDQ